MIRLLAATAFLFHALPFLIFPFRLAAWRMTHDATPWLAD